MKTTKFLQAFSLLLIFIIVISCRSSRNTTGREYPTNPAPSTKTPTNTYPVVQSNGGNLPPGQAKKIYGGQSAKAYAPGQRKKHALVIVYTPGIVINRHSDGRYYYRNDAGFTYWKGGDGRYYLDEVHLKEIEYDVNEYDDWKFKGQKNSKAPESKGTAQVEKVKEEHKVKDEQKTKEAAHTGNVKEQKGKGQSEKAKDNDQKGKDQKGNDQTDHKTKDDNPPKGKTKSKDKA